MNRYFAFVLAIVALGIVGFLLFPYLNTSQEPTPPQEIASSASLTTETISEDSATYTIDVKYPQFGFASIDANIKAKIDAAVSELKAVPPNPPESATPKNEFNGTFEDVYIAGDVISVALVLSQYTGGAHPMTIVSGMNYDPRTGKQLLQEDAFGMIGKTAAEVSVEATAQLKAKLGDAFFEEGANSNPENFSSFLVSENGVTFIFQQYQVGPYSAGVQEVSFSRVDR